MMSGAHCPQVVVTRWWSRKLLPTEWSQGFSGGDSPLRSWEIRSRSGATVLVRKKKKACRCTDAPERPADPSMVAEVITQPGGDAGTPEKIPQHIDRYRVDGVGGGSSTVGRGTRKEELHISEHQVIAVHNPCNIALGPANCTPDMTCDKAQVTA